MTAGTGEQSSAQESRPRYQPGRVVTFRVTDPTTGGEVSGHAVVLRVQGDVADLAVIGLAHIAAHVDSLAPVKVDDVPNPLPAPAPAEGSTGS